MTRYKTAQVLAGVSAVAFFVAAGLHASGYRAVVLQTQQALGVLAPLVAALWLAFAAAMLVLGCIVGLVALGRVPAGRWIVALAGCFPFITVLLQLDLLGFTRSTAMLAAVAVVTLGAAFAFPTMRRPPTVGAA
jgi:hypothetical protein